AISIAATTSEPRCQAVVSTPIIVEIPSAAETRVPSSAIAARQPTGATSSAVTAIEAATVACPDGKEFITSEDTPSDGRSREACSTWVVTFAPTSTTIAATAIDHRRCASATSTAAATTSTRNGTDTTPSSRLVTSENRSRAPSEPSRAASSTSCPRRVVSNTRHVSTVSTTHSSDASAGASTPGGSAARRARAGGSCSPARPVTTSCSLTPSPYPFGGASGAAARVRIYDVPLPRHRRRRRRPCLHPAPAPSGGGLKPSGGGEGELAVDQQVAQGGQHRGPDVADRQVEDGRDTAGDLAEGELAVARPDDRGEQGVRAHDALEPGALPQQDHRGVGVARAQVPLLGDVGRDDRSEVEQRLLAQPGEQVTDAQRRGDPLPQGGPDRAGQLLQPVPPRPDVGGGTAQHQVAEPDGLDVARGEVGHPRLGGRLPGGPVALGRQAAVAQPGLGVVRGVEHLPLHDPAVQPALVEPVAHALGPRLAAADLPVAEHLGQPARREHVADG